MHQRKSAWVSGLMLDPWKTHGLKPEQRDTLKVIHELRAGNDRVMSEQLILVEYDKRGSKPVYAAPGLLVSPSLVRTLKERTP